MDGDVLDDAAGRGDGETRRPCCLHGGRPPRRDAGSSAERRRHERGADDVRNRLSCAALVRRSTSGRRAGGGGLGVDDVASDGFSTQFERCTAQIRALLGALAVQLLHDVGEEASRGRRLAPRLVPPKGPGVILFGAVNRSVGICFCSTGAKTYKKIENVRVLVLKTATWRRAGFAEAVLVDAVGVARNVVAAASSRVAEYAFLPTKYVDDFGREFAPLEAVV